MKLLDNTTPAGFHPEISLLLGALEPSGAHWIPSLGNPPVEAVTWTPVPGMHSIGGVLLHIMHYERWWCRTFVEGLRDTRMMVGDVTLSSFRYNGGKLPEAPAQPVEWYMEHLRRNRAECLEFFRNREPEEVIERAGWKATVRWVAGHLVDHDSYHGGQAVLLKCLWENGFGRP